MPYKTTKFREARAKSLRMGKSFMYLPSQIQKEIVKSEKKFKKK